jgi:hypothetical protein
VGAVTAGTYLRDLFIWTGMALSGSLGAQMAIWRNYSSKNPPRWLAFTRMGFAVLAAAVLIGGLLLGLVLAIASG